MYGIEHKQISNGEDIAYFNYPVPAICTSWIEEHFQPDEGTVFTTKIIVFYILYKNFEKISIEKFQF